MEPEDVIRQLGGHTIVLELLFRTSVDDGLCTLVLDLVDGKTKGSRVVRVEFSGVADLSLREFGGGITQLLSLNIEDVEEWQWDRIGYRVTESERQAISFLCRDVRIIARHPLGQGEV